MPAVLLLVGALAGQALAVKRGRAVPRKILGESTWRLLTRAKVGEVALITRERDQAFLGVQGIKASATARITRAWLRKLSRLLRRPGSYFVPRCDKQGRCPQLRCRTTPRAVVTLKQGEETAQIVITVCFALQAGPSLSRLNPQVSMEPAEGKLLKLLLELFPNDLPLQEELRQWRKSR